MATDNFVIFAFTWATQKRLWCLQVGTAAKLRQTQSMGGFGSSRWTDYKRRRCVEECARQPAKTCPRCGARVRFVYAPEAADTPAWACRKCHRLTYFSRQASGTLAGDLARSMAARHKATVQAQALRQRAAQPLLGNSAREFLRALSERERNAKRADVIDAALERARKVNRG